MKIFRKFGAPPPRNWRPNTSKFGGKFRTTSQFDREYFRKGTRNRQTENGVANHDLSCANIRNLVNFGEQIAKKYDRSFERLDALVLRGSRFVVRG